MTTSEALQRRPSRAYFMLALFRCKLRLGRRLCPFKIAQVGKRECGKRRAGTGGEAHLRGMEDGDGAVRLKKCDRRHRAGCAGARRNEAKGGETTGARLNQRGSG